jgi:hypothetical protein
MKRHVTFYISVLTLVAFSATVTISQVRPPIPRASQKATVMQTIGTTEISITYSRPKVNGRKVWGDWPTVVAGEATLDDGRTRPKDAPLVPYDHLWRAGANEATLFVFPDDVIVNGNPLAAGRYSFHAIPGKEEWTLVFNRDDGQWGSFSYDKAKDALRFKAKPMWLTDSKELLTYAFDEVGEKSATVYLRWEKIKVPFTVEVKDVVGSTMNRLRAYVAAAKPDDPAPAFSAANYAKANKQTDDAAKWYETAIKASKKQVKKKASFANLRLQTNILIAAGKNADAVSSGEKAVAAGKAENADATQIAALEKRIADIKAGKQ